MNYEVDVNGNTLVIKLKGELDDYMAKSIRDRLDYILFRKDIKNLIFDLSEIDFMDSAGIGLIIGRYKIIKPRGGKSMIVCDNQYTNRILKMSGVYGLFENYPSLEDAFLYMNIKAIV